MTVYVNSYSDNVSCTRCESADTTLRRLHDDPGRELRCKECGHSEHVVEGFEPRPDYRTAHFNEYPEWDIWSKECPECSHALDVLWMTTGAIWWACDNCKLIVFVD